MTLREVLDKRKEDAKPTKHGPRKNRPWGRVQRRRYREEVGLGAPGLDYGYQLHYKNAAARKKYRAGLKALKASGVEGEALDFAIEDLTNQCCKHVQIYAGADRRVRQELRSQARREDREYRALQVNESMTDAVEHGSGNIEGSSPDDPSRADAGA